MTIVSGQPRHHEEIYRVAKEAFRGPESFLYPAYYAGSSPCFLRKDAYDSTKRSLLAWVDESGAVGGFADVRHVTQGQHHLAYLAVSPTHQGRGISRALLQSVCDFPGTVSLDVISTNARALSLYTSFDFHLESHYAIHVRPLRVLPDSTTDFPGCSIIRRDLDNYGCGEADIKLNDASTVHVGAIGRETIAVFNPSLFLEKAIDAIAYTISPDMRRAICRDTSGVIGSADTKSFENFRLVRRETQ